MAKDNHRLGRELNVRYFRLSVSWTKNILKQCILSSTVQSQQIVSDEMSHLTVGKQAST